VDVGEGRFMNILRMVLPILCVLYTMVGAFAQTQTPIIIPLYPPGHPTLQGQNEKEILR
jgi:hypothetical protein